MTKKLESMITVTYFAILNGCPIIAQWGRPFATQQRLLCAGSITAFMKEKSIIQLQTSTLKRLERQRSLDIMTLVMTYAFALNRIEELLSSNLI